MRKAIVTLRLYKRRLWTRWIFANALGEFVGLGATFALIAGFSYQIDFQGIAGRGLLLAIASLSGLVEATAVGLAQWWAFSPWMPTIKRIAWLRATLLGVFFAYVLSYLPSILIDLAVPATTPTPWVEPPAWVVTLLAVGMGAVSGAILSFAQWRVLRLAVRRAYRWIFAHMLAWGIGMPVIIHGMELAFGRAAIWQMIFIIGMTLLFAGGLVGTVHGWFLVKMVKYRSNISVFSS